MKHSVSNEQALVNILLRYWEEISAIEEEFSLCVGDGDVRPRVEFFHDAIRAFTKPSKNAADEKRLTVEKLAYDLRCIRYLADTPLASITHSAHNFSPSTALVLSGAGLLPATKKMPRDTKRRLSELYGFYGTLFSALLKATAETDYQERCDTLNHEIEAIHEIIAAFESGASMQELTNLISRLDDEALKEEIIAQLPKLKGKDRKMLSGLLSRLEASTQRKDKAVKQIDAAQHQYATSQLALYEQSRDMLKQLAGQGMNLVGQFVEAALRATGADRSRGR